MVAVSKKLIFDEAMEAFLNYCRQYETLGKFLESWVRETPHPVTRKVKNSIEQYIQMGEQLKTLGAALDALEKAVPIIEEKADPDV